MQLSVSTTAAKLLPVDPMPEAIPSTFPQFSLSRRRGELAAASGAEPSCVGYRRG